MSTSSGSEFLSRGSIYEIGKGKGDNAQQFAVLQPESWLASTILVGHFREALADVMAEPSLRIFAEINFVDGARVAALAGHVVDMKRRDVIEGRLSRKGIGDYACDFCCFACPRGACSGT
ncbi:MAG: hypothetical protein WBS14_14900 [Rhodomicrobium sp.]